MELENDSNNDVNNENQQEESNEGEEQDSKSLDISGSYLDWDELNKKNLIFNEEIHQLSSYEEMSFSEDDSPQKKGSSKNKKNSKQINIRKNSKRSKSNDDYLSSRRIGKTQIKKPIQKKQVKNQKSKTNNNNTNNNTTQNQRKTNILNLPKNQKQETKNNNNNQVINAKTSGSNKKQDVYSEQGEEDEEMLVISSKKQSKKQSSSTKQKKKKEIIQNEQQNQEKVLKGQEEILNQEEEGEEEDAILIDQQSTNMMLTYHTKSPDVIIEFIDKHIIQEDTLFCLRAKNIKHSLEEFSYLKDRMRGTFKSYYKFKDHNGNYIDYQFVKNKKSNKLQKKTSSKSKLSSKNQSLNEKNPKQVCQDVLDTIIKNIENSQEDLDEELLDDDLLDNLDNLLNDNDIQNQIDNRITDNTQLNLDQNNSSANLSSKKLENQDEELEVKEYKKQQLRYLKLKKFNKYTEEELFLLKQTNIKSIDDLRDKGVNNLYATFENFDIKFRKLMVYMLMFRCKSVNSYIYALQLFDIYETNVKKYDIENKFLEQKQQDLKKLYKEDKQNKIQVSQWPLIPQDKRIYEHIEQYQPVPIEDKEDIYKRMESEKVPVKCPPSCVCKTNDYEKLGEFSLEEGNWSSECINRKNKIECVNCDNCTNQGNLNQLQKRIGKDLNEQVCWGIDIFTRKNIFFVLPELAKQQEKINFIEQTLLKAANLIQDKGYDIKQVLQYIINNSQPKQYEPYVQDDDESSISEESDQEQSNSNIDQEKNNNNNEKKPEFIEKKTSSKQQKQKKSLDIKKQQQIEEENKQQYQYIFTNKDRKFAKLLLKIVNLEIDNQAFRLHTKGVGVVCINPQGIKKNEFITKYIGEIYSSWRWIERQDMIKKQLLSQKQQDILVDFYNIMFEVHKDDPKGYDLMFVDPILKGNYSSRLSHCCDPNCLNMTTVSNKQYIIGMYAMKNIGYGQELCWDYNSFTESKQEHNKAFCLCGSFKCRGKYLALNKNVLKENNTIFEQIHDFMQKNIDILKACENTQLTKDEQNLMEEYSIRKNIKQGSPQWLIKWIAQILSIIKQENTIFYEELCKQNKDNNNKAYCVNTAFYRTENRIQNLVQSVDRIKYVLQKNQEDFPPFQALSQQEILGYLYGNNIDYNSLQFNYQTTKGIDKSILGHLFEITQKYSIIDKCRQLEDYIKSFKDLMFQLQNTKSFDYKNRLVRLFFLRIAHLLRNTPKTYFHYQGLQLFIYFYAFTHKYYQMNDYKSFTSDKILLRNNELFNAESIHNQNNILKGDTEESKSYNTQFIIGQMNLWYKQTVSEPEKSFQSDKRGLMQYPNLKSFDHQQLNWPYNQQQQQEKAQVKKINKKEKSQQYFIQKQQEALKKIYKNNNQTTNSNSDTTTPINTISQQYNSQSDTRSLFLNKLLNSPKQAWYLEGSKWNFQNKLKIMGTIFIDQEIFKEQFKIQNFCYQIIDIIDSGYNQQFKLFKELEKTIYNQTGAELIENDINDMQKTLIEIENKINIKFEDQIELNTSNYKFDATEEQLKTLIQRHNEKKKRLQEQQNQQQQQQLGYIQNQNQIIQQPTQLQQQLQLQQQQQQQQFQQSQQENIPINTKFLETLAPENLSLNQQQSEQGLSQQSSGTKKKQKALSKQISVSLTNNINVSDTSNKIQLVIEKTPSKNSNQESHVQKKRGPKKKESQQKQNSPAPQLDEEDLQLSQFKIKKKVKPNNISSDQIIQDQNQQNEQINYNMLLQNSSQNNKNYQSKNINNQQNNNFNNNRKQQYNQFNQKQFNNNSNNSNIKNNYNNNNMYNKRMNNNQYNMNNNYNSYNNSNSNIYNSNNNNYNNNSGNTFNMRNNFSNNNQFYNNNYQNNNSGPNNQDQYQQDQNINYNNYQQQQQQNISKTFNNNSSNINNFNQNNDQNIQNNNDNFDNNFDNSSNFNNYNQNLQNNNNYYQNDFQTNQQYNDQYPNNSIINSNQNVQQNLFQNQQQLNENYINENSNQTQQIPVNQFQQQDILQIQQNQNLQNDNQDEVDDDVLDGLDDNILNDMEGILGQEGQNQIIDQQLNQNYNDNNNNQIQQQPLQQFQQQQQNVEDFLDPQLNNQTNNVQQMNDY